MNSTMAVDGTLFTAKNPNYGNLMGTDIDVWNKHGLPRPRPELGDAGLRLEPGPVRPVRAVARLRRGPGRQHVRPDHRRHRPRRLDADRRPRHLERHADDHLRVPVAALRRRRQQLRRHPRRDGPTYTLAPADVGSTDPRRSSPPSTTPAPRTRPPRRRPAPSAARALQRHLPASAASHSDGQTLTTTIGGWNGTAPLDYDVQWQRCDSRRHQLRRHRGRHRLELRAHRRRRRLDDPQRGHRLQRRRLRDRRTRCHRHPVVPDPPANTVVPPSPASPATARR